MRERKLSPSIHYFDNELIQPSAERLDVSSSTCLSRSPQDLVLSELFLRFRASKYVSVFANRSTKPFSW